MISTIQYDEDRIENSQCYSMTLLCEREKNCGLLSLILELLQAVKNNDTRKKKAEKPQMKFDMGIKEMTSNEQEHEMK